MAASSPRAPLAWLLLPLLLGYLTADLLPVWPRIFAAIGLTLAAGALGATFWTSGWRQWVWPVCACAGGYVLAVGYYQFRMAPPPGWDGLPPREAILSLEVSRLYAARDGWTTQRGIAVITTTDPHLADLRGQRIYFSARPDGTEDTWERGTVLHVRGVLERIASEDGAASDFATHLLRSGIHFRLTRITLEDVDPPGVLPSFFASGRQRFENALRRGSSEDNAPVRVYVAMLLGMRAELAPEQKDRFLRSGTLHLFAISGLHIGVIAVALHTVLTLLRVPPKAGALVGLLLLFCFVGITGFSPSAVRAFFGVFFFWGARFCGRAPNPVAALANSAIAVLLLFPFQLWSPGFQLSYSVVAGILFLGLPLSKRWQERWTPYRYLPEASRTTWQSALAGSAHNLLLTLGVSLSATLMSSPLSIHYFGIFAPGAVLLNVLLVPLAGLVIVSGFISVSLDLLGLSAGGILFNHAAWVVVAVMDLGVRGAIALPGLFWLADFRSSLFAGLAVTAMLGALLACSHQRWREPFFHFVVPFGVFVLFLLSAARLTFPAP
jgi:competence protein ComEC